MFASCKNIVRVCCFLLLLLPVALQAQENTTAIKGKVLDNFGHPLPGARIGVHQSGSWVLTNGEGRFSIDAVPGNILVVSHPAYLIAETKVQDGAELSIRLAARSLPAPGSSPFVTDTIVPLGRTISKMNVLYGEKNIRTALGATSTIYTDQLTTTPASLYAYALPGRLAGLFTKQGNGWGSLSSASITQGELLFNVPNQSLIGATGSSDNSEIFFSLRGQGPVTVIDGVQRDIFALDPETIESISVQKDALSSILLGQKSSRGVLLVTTKKPL
ncbi:MAG: TonB-dependent receptor plug domain-containing protein, partial [Pseudobacter sp.]|uniref:TonB-dependent receptor plug domain-containing protein n=1 Tax=Pseudobacter sp. TaxID=2045420 RepID=UPI003F819470